MEGVSVNVYKGLRGYWARRGYQRLGNGGRATPADSSGRSRRRRRSFRWRRVKVAPRVKLMKLIIRSPKRFLIWLRDAYVKMMMGFATSRVCSAGYGGSVADADMSGFGRGPLKEYDQKMIVEIYKSLMVAQGQLVPQAGVPRSGVVVCRR
ncbi:uncharacterized protein LOC116209978 [Punica granatum]|uniref:Uncharacterized protein LOC116209978 n=1 Tax=Punica granatum TaxID=22663 RepID=A0A6P8DUU4_PUNGR|nr:uncharacterized protein LOC116209978 [Punica granatum]